MVLALNTQETLVQQEQYVVRVVIGVIQSQSPQLLRQATKAQVQAQQVQAQQLSLQVGHSLYLDM